jgi:putative phage-type endonuclease
MTAVELLPAHEATPANDAWHKLRQAGISASEIAAVLGISPWESPFSLYWRKVNGWGVDVNDEMRAGTRAEPVIRQWYEDECDPHENLTVRLAGLYASGERPWQLATPDGLVHMSCGDCDGRGGGGPASGPETSFLCASCYGTGIGSPALSVLECKYLPYSWDGWGEPGTDEIPVYYRAQGLQQLDVLEVEDVQFAAWHGAEFRHYTIRRDEKDLRVMRIAGRDFIDRLANGDPPPIDGHSATVRTLKALHPSIEDMDIDVPVEFAEGYRRARRLAARVDAVKDRYEARARELLGNGRRLMCNGHLVCSRSVYEQSGDTAELLSLDGEESLVDRLNPGRAASYLTPKGRK